MSTEDRNDSWPTKGSDGHALVRVAIYTHTHTSAGKGLGEESGSVHAQREACEKYARAQAHLGWKVLPTRYDDSDATFGNLERPAFRRLIADVDAKKIDVVVVHRVDRSMRSFFDLGEST